VPENRPIRGGAGLGRLVAAGGVASGAIAANIDNKMPAAVAFRCEAGALTALADSGDKCHHGAVRWNAGACGRQNAWVAATL
jgi:hypothetical protein